MRRSVCLLLTVSIMFLYVACANPNENVVPGITTSPEARCTLDPFSNKTYDQSPIPTYKVQETPKTNITYEDGTYQGTGDKWQGGNEDAVVVVLDGSISSVVLRRLDLEGREVNYDVFSGKEIEGRLYPNLKQYRKDVADRMIERQSYDVDAISGATLSSTNWKLAVKRALEYAKK